MGIDWETGDDNSSGNKFCNDEGWFHFVVVDATDTPIKANGELIENAMFGLDCTIAAGTVPGCKDKAKDICFFYPRSTEKDGGTFSRKKVDRALIALNAIDPMDRNKKVSIDTGAMVGQQFVSKMRLREGQTRTSIDGLHIYHVDDPEVAGQPKNEQMLGLIEPQFRRVGNRPSGSDPANARNQPAANGAGGQEKPDAAQQAKAAPMDLEKMDI